MRVDQRREVLAGLERRDREDVRAPEIRTLAVRREAGLDAGVGDVDPLARDAERLGDVVAGEARVDDHDVARLRRVRVLRAVHALACGVHPLRMVERNEIVDHRRAHAAPLRRIPPVAEVEDVELADHALDDRSAEPAPGGAQRVRGRHDRQRALDVDPRRARARSRASRAGSRARTRRPRARRPRRGRAASRGCSCRRPCADATAARRRRRSSPGGRDVLEAGDEDAERPRIVRTACAQGVTANRTWHTPPRAAKLDRRSSSSPGRRQRDRERRRGARDGDVLRDAGEELRVGVHRRPAASPAVHASSRPVEARAAVHVSPYQPLIERRRAKQRRRRGRRPSPCPGSSATCVADDLQRRVGEHVAAPCTGRPAESSMSPVDCCTVSGCSPPPATSGARAEVVDAANAAVPELVLPAAIRVVAAVRASVTSASRPTALSTQRTLGADPGGVRGGGEARERVNPELERQPGQEEAERDERRQHRRIASRQPEEERAERRRESRPTSSDDVAEPGDAVAEIPPRLEERRVGLRVDVHQAEERQRRRAARRRRAQPRRLRAAGAAGRARARRRARSGRAARRRRGSAPRFAATRSTRTSPPRRVSKTTSGTTAAQNTRSGRSRWRAFATSTISAANGSTKSERSSAATW